MKFNTILTIVGIVFALLYLQQCNRSSSLKDKMAIMENNTAALNDSITSYKDKSNTLVYEKGILIASEKELKDLNKELYDEVKDLKNNPKVVIKEVFIIEHDTTYIETTIKEYGDGDYGFVWKHDTTYAEGNFQHLGGETRFNLGEDGISDPFTIINENRFGVSLITGLEKNDDGNYSIFVKSKYPGFTPTSIEGSVIDKKMLQSNESDWVIGPHLGYGIQFQNSGTLSHGWTIGFGVTYNLNKKIKKLFKR